MLDLDAIPFLEARHYRVGRRAPIRFLVIHDMESSEKATSAEEWQQRTHTQDKVSSVHYGVDNDSICCAVFPTDEAFHAAGGNRDTIGTEHPGVARQTRDEWLDTYGIAMLRRSAALQAALCKRFGIPVRRATVADYVAAQNGQPFVGGLLGHIDITEAAKILGRAQHGHWDPGPNFPWAYFMALVSDAYDEGDEMLSDDDKKWIAATIDKAIETHIGQVASPSTAKTVYEAAREAIRDTPPKST